MNEKDIELRDYFAGQVIGVAVVMAAQGPNLPKTMPAPAVMAYEIADAMLAERACTQGDAA